MRKKIVKAHQGMAHVPKPSGQQAPSKAKGTAGTTPRRRRMIGLPQRFRGAVKELLSGRRREPTPPSYVSTPMKPSDGQSAKPSRGRRMIGLPQKFKGGRRGSQNLPAWAKKTLQAPRPLAPPTDPTPVKPVKEPSILTDIRVPKDTGFSCPSPDTLINLSDDKTKQAGDLAIGDIVHTQHETTLEWGDYAVSHVSIIPNSERLKLIFDTTEIVCSLSHKMYVDNKGWIEAKDIEIDDIVNGHTLKDVIEWEAGDVVKITIEEAHTYIAAGLLSHNKRYASPTIYQPPTQVVAPQVVAPRIPRGLRAVSKPINQKGGVKKLKESMDSIRKVAGRGQNTFRTVNKGGYISRAKYGIVDNLKKGKK